MAKSKAPTEKEDFIPTETKMSELYKHMNDWYQDHRGQAFISPRNFQIQYTVYDKYDADSFRKVFYRLKKKFQSKDGNEDNNPEDNDDLGVANESPKKMRGATKKVLGVPPVPPPEGRSLPTSSTHNELARIVYKVDFHKAHEQREIWKGIDDNTILQNIFKKANESAVVNLSTSTTSRKNGGNKDNKNVTRTTRQQEDEEDESEIESKIIVVMELPAGGTVTEFAVEHNNCMLNVNITKHALMLDPNAIAFAAVKTGVHDNRIDGPNTCRGGIRLNECASALANYEKKIKMINGGGTKFNLPMKIKLPHPVEKNTVKHFTYCFDKTSYNNMQYSIAYFEFDILAMKKKANSFIKGASMVFSSSSARGQDDQNYTPSRTSSRNYTSTTATSRCSSSTSRHAKNTSSSSSKSSTYGGRTSHHNDDMSGGRRMNDDDGGEEGESCATFTASQVEEMRKEIQEQMEKEYMERKNKIEKVVMEKQVEVDDLNARLMESKKQEQQRKQRRTSPHPRQQEHHVQQPMVVVNNSHGTTERASKRLKKNSEHQQNKDHEDKVDDDMTGACLTESSLQKKSTEADDDNGRGDVHNHYVPFANDNESTPSKDSDDEALS